MTGSSSKLPSVGFVMVLGVHALIAAFFVWAASTPDLDRVWTLHHLFKIGEHRKLETEDREILERSMARHPRLAEDLLDGRTLGLISANDDGWIATPSAIVLRMAEDEKPRVMVLDVQTPEDLLPYRISLRGSVWRKKLKAKKKGEIRVSLPPPQSHGEVLEIRAHGKPFKADPSMLGIRVSFEEAP